MSKDNPIVVDAGSPGEFRQFAYLPKAQAAILNVDSTKLVDYRTLEGKDIDNGKKKVTYIPWGVSDDMPNQIIAKVGANPATSTGVEFNVQVGFGDGITPCKKVFDEKTNTYKLVPTEEFTEVNEFLEANDINGFLIEQLTDLKHFYNIWTELILDRNPKPANRKVVELNHKEAAFSRVSEMTDSGDIEYHLYYSKFGTNDPDYDDKDIEVTPMLNSKRPLLDLQRRLGIKMRLDGKKKADRNAYRFVLPTPLPTPGRFYYQMPYWYSIFTSGWYDYACAIPTFKNALMDNQMTIKYAVYIYRQYWTELFNQEGITDKKKQDERMVKEYQNIQDFLAGKQNTGKAIISKFNYASDKMQKYIIIEPIENAFKGGEYIEDSVEASNIILFALGVHSSLIGSFPQKNSAISGTEARELFTIKQALMKLTRDRLLRPLYLIKRINKWPEECHFTIPNMVLTTLDEKKDSKTVISQNTGDNNGTN